MQRALGAAAWQRALGALVGPLALGLALVVGLPATPAGANGTPIRIVLSYLNGVSNFGPQNATGVAELVTSEGEVRVTTTGLQRLQGGEQYHAWLTTANNADRLWLGSFEVSEQGVGRLDRVIAQAIPEKDWGLMILTAEQGAAQPPQPSNRRAIAGRFPSTAAAGTRPGQLPNTGGTPVTTTGAAPETTGAGSGLSTEGLVLLGILVVGALAFGLGRASGRRGPVMTIGSDAATGSDATTGPDTRRGA